MNERVSTLEDVSRKRSNYLLIVSNESHYNAGLQRLLADMSDSLGEQAGVRIRVIRAYRNSLQRTYEELLQKRWPQPLRARFETERAAVLTFIKTDFAKFDPETDDWVIVWLSAFGSQKNAIIHFFDLAEREIRRSDELFAFLRSKMDGVDRSFPQGSITAKDGPIQSSKKKRRIGRDPVLDPAEPLRELVQTLLTLVRKYEIQPGQHGWKIELARKAIEARLIARSDNSPFDAKSVSERFGKSGVFDKVESLFQKTRQEKR